MKDYDIYLFDFDGCLVDTVDSLAYVFIQSLKDYGLVATREEVPQFTRQPLPLTYQQKGGDMSKFDEFYANLLTYLNCEETVKRSKMFPDMLPTIKKLKKMGKITGIVTSNNVPHCKEVLNLFNVDTNLFDVYVGNQESPICKPNPDPVLKALELLNFNGDKEKVVYIGDAIDDVTAGKAAGVNYILLDRFNEYSFYKEEKITTLAEVIDG